MTAVAAHQVVVMATAQVAQVPEHLTQWPGQHPEHAARREGKLRSLWLRSQRRHNNMNGDR